MNRRDFLRVALGGISSMLWPVTDGHFYGIHVYNRALNAQEIANLYWKSNPKLFRGLVSAWVMNEGGS